MTKRHRRVFTVVVTGKDEQATDELIRGARVAIEKELNSQPCYPVDVLITDTYEI